MNALVLASPRRRFLQRAGLASAALFFTRPGLFAEQLATPPRRPLTPQMTEGPFYPDKLPLDTDNDLLVVNDAITPAVGEIVHLGGQVLTASGAPARNVVVEIWQVDHQGIYLNTRDQNHGRRDANFQGYGRFLTDRSGAYYFRTIKPVAYPGRSPHIHLAVSRNGKRLLTTQALLKGAPGLEGDGVYREMLASTPDPAARASVLLDPRPLAGSVIGASEARFDLVLGVTPSEPEHDEAIHGGIAPAQGMGPGGPGGGFEGGPLPFE